MSGTVNRINRFKNKILVILLCNFCFISSVYSNGANLINPVKDGSVLLNSPFATIKGTVYNDKAEPVSGASVIIRNSSIGTVTNENGVFTINAKVGDVLQISAIGYTTKSVNITSLAELNVVLENDVAGLEDVVVVGYGRQKTITKTASVSSITGDEIRRTPTASLQNTLTGKITGVISTQRSGQPGSDAADLYIRGVSNFNGASVLPYILVDDIEYSYSQFANIDPNEVESISILKDAATTAIYGIKGANGVILVTTKRGKTGRPTINFKTQLGFQVPVKQLQVLDSYNAALLRNEALKNDALAVQFSDWDLELFKNGTDPYRHPNIDWYKTLIRKYSLMTTNTIDVSGGTEKVKYFTSLGYLWQNGNIKDFTPPSIYPQEKINTNYYFKRYNFRSNLDIKATNTLNFKLDLSGNHEEQNSPAAGGYGVFYEIAHYEQLPPFAYNIYNPDGTYGFSDGGIVPKPAEGNANNIVGRLALGGYNRNYGTLININSSAIQKLDVITRGLSLRGTVSYSNDNTASRSLTRGNDFPSFGYNDSTKVYTPRDYNVYRTAPLGLGYSGGSPVRRITVQGALNYARDFGPHSVAALLLYNQSSTQAGTNPYNREFDYVPGKLRGYTFRATYNYMQKYLFELNGAYNGTNRFVTQKRYGFFPAVSVGYNISEEEFFKKALPAVSLLKFRGSWGIVGDDGAPAGSRYAYEEVYNSYWGATYFGETPLSYIGIREGQLGNNDVGWQNERKIDVGVDFSFFKGKISGSFDYFDNYRYGILISRKTVPLFFGVIGVPPVNMGKVQNKGYDFEIKHRNTFGEFGYNITLTYTYAKNKIIEMDEPVPKYPWMKQTGQSIGTTRMFTWDGYYTAAEIADPKVAKPSGVILPGFLKYRDLNEDGVINDEDRAYIGLPNIPQSNGGVNLGITYKGFSINTLLQGSWGYNFNVGWRLATPFKANLQPLHLKRWTPETAATAEFPTLTSNFNGSYMSPTDNQISTFWSMKSRYLRIRSVEMGYDIPERVVSNIGMRTVRVFVSGYNLHTWSNVFKKYQYDPETSTNLTSNSYPQQRIFNVGALFTFK